MTTESTATQTTTAQAADWIVADEQPARRQNAAFDALPEKYQTITVDGEKLAIGYVVSTSAGGSSSYGDGHIYAHLAIRIYTLQVERDWAGWQEAGAFEFQSHAGADVKQADEVGYAVRPGFDYTWRHQHLARNFDIADGYRWRAWYGGSLRLASGNHIEGGFTSAEIMRKVYGLIKSRNALRNWSKVYRNDEARWILACLQEIGMPHLVYNGDKYRHEAADWSLDVH